MREEKGTEGPSLATARKNGEVLRRTAAPELTKFRAKSYGDSCHHTTSFWVIDCGRNGCPDVDKDLALALERKVDSPMIWPIFTSGVLFHVVYVVVDGKSYRCTKAEWELSGDTCYFVAGGLTSNLKEAKRYCKSLIKKKSTMAMVDSEDDMKALARSASKQNGIHQVWLDGSNTKKEKPGAFVWHDATLTPIDKTATPWGIGKDGNPFPHPKHNNEWITLAFKDNGDVSGLEHGMGDLVGILKTRQPDHAGYACMAPAVPEADMRMHLRFQENNKH